MTISALVFFAAIGVVGWWGLSGIQTGEGNEEPAAPMVIFAGGAPTQASVEEMAAVEAVEEVLPEDDYVIGDYGDPASELYADDDDGGWSEAAMDSASDFFASSSEGDRGRERN